MLWHATLRWQREVAATLRPLGITHVQFVLLAGAYWLETRDARGPSQRELADHAGTDPMMTSQVVRALERDDLLRREIDDEDARIRRLRTTAKGRKLAVRSVEAIEGLDARVLMRFAESPELVDVLRRIAGRDEAGNPLD